jgi:hypothetical protein
MKRLFFIFFIAFNLFLIDSCVRNNIEHIDFERNIVTRFLSLPANSDESLIKISTDLRQKNLIKHFIPEIATKDGIPLWNHAIIEAKEPYMRSADAVQTVLLPLSLPNSNQISAILVCCISDSVTYNLFRKGSYQSYGLDKPVDSADAEKIIGLILLMENKIWGRELFYIMDGRLFMAGHNEADLLNKRIIRFSRIEQGINTGSRDAISNNQWCYSITGSCSASRRIVPAGSGMCTNNYCISITAPSWLSSNAEWIPAVEGGGAQGGSNNYDGFSYPMAVTNSLTDSLSNPCLRAAKDKLPNEKLIFFIAGLFNHSSSSFIDIKFVERTNIVDATGYPLFGGSDVSGNGKSWIIKMNPNYFNGTILPHSSQEYAGQVMLHEIIHAFIYLYKDLYGLTTLNTFNTHEVMFENFINLMAAFLTESFNLTYQDAIALALSGLDDVLQNEYDNNGTLISYNQNMNNFAATKYGITIPVADSISTLYMTGQKGTRCP